MARTRRALKRATSKKRQLVLESRFSWVVRNQKGLCWYCSKLMGMDCTKEHLLSQAEGGTDTYPRANLKGACGDCNQIVGHLPVEHKLMLRQICQELGKKEMTIMARKLVRAQLRAAFSNTNSSNQIKRKGYENRKR